ncbi:MAG: protein-glutamate O-methyltransferase [Alphaproteobacteria bacterium]|nr:protein-glutamate O-methyltransferase [Alphaproteobacteria bacterium]
MTGADFTLIATLLKERSGLIITPDKGYLLETRLGPIVRERGLASLAALIEVLRQPGSDALKNQIVEAMTTNETSFFRDSHPFDTLRKSVIPGLIQRRATRALRIWSAACSTGQEPYSIAMTLKDHFPILGGWRIEIVATDISAGVLERARSGTYSTFEVQRGLPIQMLVRHFDNVDDQWRIKDELRRNITFRPINLLGDLASLGTFDIVLCRNVLIYFDQPTKTRIMHAIAHRIAPDGVLMLGGAESVIGLCDAFSGVPGLRGVYGHAAHIPPKPASWLNLPVSAVS